VAFELAIGEEAEDFAEGALDGEVVFGLGEGEAGGAVLGAVRVGTAGGVMEVAELFPAEGGAAALVAVGEEVAALVGFRLGHRSPWLLWDGVKCKKPATGAGFLLLL